MSRTPRSRRPLSSSPDHHTGTAAAKFHGARDILSTTNAEIAQQLFVSATTVKAHLAHIYRKLGVNDRTAAVTTALECQIIRLDDA